MSLGFEGKTTEERARAFAEKGKDTEWTFHSVLQFMQAEKEKVKRKEVTAATIRNFVKCIKLYCEVCRILIDWKTITRGLPQTRRFGNDRSPTLQELRKVSEYPDRRMKPVVYAMASSGIFFSISITSFDERACARLKRYDWRGEPSCFQQRKETGSQERKQECASRLRF